MRILSPLLMPFRHLRLAKTPDAPESAEFLDRPSLNRRLFDCVHTKSWLFDSGLLAANSQAMTVHRRARLAKRSSRTVSPFLASVFRCHDYSDGSVPAAPWLEVSGVGKGDPLRRMAFQQRAKFVASAGRPKNVSFCV